MKPLDRLKERPSREVLIHELGHTIAGLSFGLAEGGIELCDPSSGDVARSHYSRTLGTPQDWIIRGLSGMYCQAMLSPESMADDLRSDILNGLTFSNRRDEIKSQRVPCAIVDHGFLGDWQCVLSTAQLIADDFETQLSEIETAHQKLAHAFVEREMRQMIDLAYLDMESWLETEDIDVGFSPLLIYPIRRIRALA